MLYKFIQLLFWGLFCAIVLYPILHEFGHSIAIIICGGKVCNIVLFPLPNILCNMNQRSAPQLIFIGVAGNIIPTMLSLVLQPKHFIFFYMNTIIKVICILAFVISAVGLIGNIPLLKMQDDFVRLSNIGGSKILLLSFCVILIILLTISIEKSKPFKKLYLYFDF